eukprot:15484444-Alexandrium_andersonii.AAC.1
MPNASFHTSHLALAPLDWCRALSRPTVLLMASEPAKAGVVPGFGCSAGRPSFCGPQNFGRPLRDNS